MPVPLGDSLSDDDTLFRSQIEVEESPTRRAESEPDVRVMRRFHRKKAAKLRRKWLQEFYSSLDPRSLEKLMKKRKQMGKRRKEDEESISYKYGRWAMIALALFSIPVDGWKLYQEVGRTERALDGPTSIEVFDYYSSAITTHVMGLAAAVDNSLILTIGCRMLSTVLYQTSYGSKGNSSVPTDPKQLQKYIRDNVPAHRLPKGYRFPDDLDSGVAGKRGKKGTRKSKGKKSKKTTANKKKTAKSPASKNRSARKAGTREKKNKKKEKTSLSSEKKDKKP